MFPAQALSLTAWGLLILVLLLAAAPLLARHGRRITSYPMVWLGYGLICTIACPILAADQFHALTLACISLFIGLPLLLSISTIYAWHHRHILVSAMTTVMTLALVAIAVEAFYLEPHNLEFDKIEIYTNKVTEPLKIAVLADIQTDDVGEWEDLILAKTMAVKPDLILFTGNYIQCLTKDDQRREQTKLNNLLRKHQISAPQGCYALAGNVEATDPTWPDIFKGTKVKASNFSESAILNQTAITALSFEDSLNRTLANVKEDRYHIVFGNCPDFAMSKSLSGDLFIAGPIHSILGGQVQLPIRAPLATLSAVPEQWAAGYDKTKGPLEIAPDKKLIVSRGLGMERHYAPALRFCSAPQLLLITVRPK